LFTHRVKIKNNQSIILKLTSTNVKIERFYRTESFLKTKLVLCVRIK
jgi:hypothetical protein